MVTKVMIDINIQSTRFEWRISWNFVIDRNFMRSSSLLALFRYIRINFYLKCRKHVCFQVFQFRKPHIWLKTSKMLLDI